MASSEHHDSNDLLASVIAAADPHSRFSQVSSIETTCTRSGLFSALKGYPEPAKFTAFVNTKQPRVTYINFVPNEDEGERWVWTPKRVWKESADGTVLESQDNPRDTMFRERRIETPWSDLQLLYFGGYAIWNYFVAPFYLTWPGFETKELEPHDEAGRTWRVLEVTYPDDFDTHSKVQKYYYDSKFHLRRLDYVVDITGGSGGAHYVYDEKDVDGLMVPMLRRVVANPDGQAVDLSGPSLVLLNFQAVVVRNEMEAAKL